MVELLCVFLLWCSWQVNPEAPSGSFRRKDLERQEANLGLDGKVYSFIDAPSDESSEVKKSPLDVFVAKQSPEVKRMRRRSLRRS